MTQASREKWERLSNRKIVLGLTALLMGMIVICVSSFIPYVFHPENLRTERFLTDIIINSCIVILATICMMFISQTSNAQNPKSKIAKSTAAFILSKETVIKKGLGTFRQWIRKVQQPADIQDIKERILMSAGIEDSTVLNLAVPEIKALENKAQIYEKVPYPALTKEQIRVVIRLKAKGINVKLVPPEYYLSARNIAVKKTRSERAANEGKKTTSTMAITLATRLTILLLFSSIITMLAKDLTEEVTTMEAIVTLFVRLWNFFTSCFMGYLLGCALNDLTSEYIDMRIEVHSEFLEDKEFKGVDIKEQAKEEFVNRMKEEQKVIMLPIHSKE